jgi:transposase-like protein
MTRWRRSGLSAEQFAKREGVRTNTLLWWSSQLRRGTRAEHGSSTPAAIEIALDEVRTLSTAGFVEVAVGGAVIRCAVGTDAMYVAALVRALRG